MKITRKNYLDGKVSHEEYYGHLVNLLGIQITRDNFIHGYSLKAAHALDPHFNTIPLRLWDLLAVGRPVPKGIRETVDPCFGSACDWVCVYKEAARQFVSREG